MTAFEKKEKTFKNKVIEHQEKAQIQLRIIAKLRKKVQMKDKPTQDKKKQIAKPKTSLKKVGISIFKMYIPCRLNVGNNYSYVSFENFSPENINSIFPKGKKGYGKSDTAKIITLEIKGNNSVKNFKGKVRYSVRQGKVSFPLRISRRLDKLRQFPYWHLEENQMH